MAEADIVLETPDGRVLLVECTWMNDPSLDGAAQLRDSLVPLWLGEYEYFLLTLRTELHLWRRETPPGSLPDFSASARRVWSDYLGKLADSEETLQSRSMELAVAAWLSDLASNVRQPDPASEPDKLLVESGLYNQMKHASVRLHVEA
jgi:hypothetical protein